MTARKRPTARDEDSAAKRRKAPYDLEFVRVDIGETHAGGWYRELPGEQIEVMSLAHRERVPLDDSPPAEKARAVVAKIYRKQPH